MPDTAAIPRPSRLWKQLSPDRKQQAAVAFWQDENAANEQAEAIGLIAQRIKFRLKSVINMPVEKKAHYVIGMSSVSEILAARLLVAYHLAHQRPMMGAFLDALGIKHEGGMIADEETPPPTADRLKAAAASITASYPAEDVAMYLSTLMWQDPETWGALGDLPEAVVPGISQ